MPTSRSHRIAGVYVAPQTARKIGARENSEAAIMRVAMQFASGQAKKPSNHIADWF